MAIEHMVWIKFNDGVGPERIAEHLAALAALKRNVPGIEHLAVGENFTDRAQGYTHGLLVRVADREALTGYLEHPNHVAVAGPLKQDASIMAMDIEG